MIPAVTTPMKRLTHAAALAVAVGLPATASATTVTATIPFQGDVLACNGDTIQLSGQLLVTLSVTLNNGGGATFATHTQPQGISGNDIQTGTKYVGTGLTRDVSIVTPSAATTFTFINRFHIQATKGDQSFDVSQTLHVTQLADGTVTGFVDNLSVKC